MTERVPLAFGPFVFDAEAARLTRDDQVIKLPPRPFALLEQLLQQPGRLLTKDMLLDAVWGHRHVSESVLKVCVNTLRIALDDDARQPRWIETVAGRGYRFAGQLAPADLAPQQAAAAVPRASEALIGRDHELQTLLPWLGQHRLLTLTGGGGIGKTRMALALAAAAPHERQSCWVALEAVADGADLVATVAHALALSPAAAASADGLVRALAERSLLLVLDNCEHLLHAVSALVAGLLAQTARVVVLATSQEPLHIAGEQVWRLAPLALPALDGAADAPAAAALVLLQQRLQQRDAVHLFDDPERAAALCRWLDGVPLAIELAAARVPLLGLAGVLEQLRQGQPVLTQGRRDAAPRQRSLRATLDWSHGLLSAQEQALFHCLGVFPGSFSVAAAQAVAQAAVVGLDGQSAGGVMAGLAQLIDKSLLISEPAVAGAAPRLRLFEATRSYALEWLTADGRHDEIRARHAAWVGAHLKAAAAQAHDQPTQTWADALQPDLHDLRQALRHGAAHDVPLALQLFVDASLLWQRLGLRGEAVQWWQRLGALCTPDLPRALQAGLGQAQGVLLVYGHHGQVAEVIQRLEQAAAWHEAEGQLLDAYFDLYLLNKARLRQDPLLDDRVLWQRMQSLQAPGWGMMRCRYTRAIAGLRLRDQGDGPGYQRYCRAEIERMAAAGDRHQVWVWSYGLALAEHDDGHAERAIERLQQVLDEVQAAGLLAMHATSLAMLASMRLQQGQWPQAREQTRQAVALLRADGMLWWMAGALAFAAYWRGRNEDALRLLGWSDGLTRHQGLQPGPMFGRLRADLEGRLLARVEPGLVQALLAEGVALDETTALNLALGAD